MSVAQPALPAASAIVEAPTAPLKKLSPQTEKVLSGVPSGINTPAAQPATKVSLDRTVPSAQTLQVSATKKLDVYEANGIKISVRRPGLDTTYELNRAYTAFSGGDTNTAIDIYKNILNADPLNQDALFALASIYHRQGELDKARPLYATLLKNYPNNQAGLSNFLTLVSDESPQEAVAELARLEQRNPDFSPIPAQEGLLLYKLGYQTEAHDKMLRAIELAPDNLTYKYNLAIMLDKSGNYPEAADLYRALIEAKVRGAMVPAPLPVMQKRLDFIVTAMTQAQVNKIPQAVVPATH